MDKITQNSKTCFWMQKGMQQIRATFRHTQGIIGMKDRVCTHCYHVGQPTTQGMGSFSVDALMWLIFFSLSMFSSVFPLMLIPLGWTIYHIAIYRKSTCPKCGRLNMVSTTSRKGLKALKGPSVVISYSAADDPNRKDETQPQGERRGRRANDNSEPAHQRRPGMISKQ